MDVRIAVWNGVPTIFLNGHPVTGLMNWNRYPNERDTALFRDAGISFYSFMGNLFVENGEVPDEERATLDGAIERMRMTRENIDRTMSMLLSVNPDIKVLPRIILNAPVWWLKANPDDVLISYNVSTRSYSRLPRPSFPSERWSSLWTQTLETTIEYFEERWTEHIIGYHTGMGHCGEHTYQWWDHIGDFSPVQKRAFQEWLRKNYSSVEELNRRWGSSYSSFEAVPLPEAERLADYSVRAPSLLRPEKESDLIDFQKFSSDVVADAVLLEARTVKRTLERLGRTKLCGVFYGYINPVANSTQAAMGHGALTRVLRSPDIDFICGPLSYAARQNGGTVMPQMIPGSILAHGKFFYNEDDTGTHVVPCEHHGYIPATAEESIHAERRNFMETWRSGGSQWWMDLYGIGWFLDDRLKEEFSRLRAFAEEHLAHRESLAEIAVFVSLESSHYLRDTPAPLTGNLIEQQLCEIGAIGAPFDLFQEEDLPLLIGSGQIRQYKFCLFLNSVAMPETIREAVRTHLQNSGRTLLWFYAPGYIRGERRGAEHAEELTGIHFSALESGIMPMLTETWIGGQRICYGLSRAVYPRLAANDPDAAELGYFVNATTIAGRSGGHGAALVEKSFPGWRSIWSASPGLPSSLLAKFAREAGVHLFSDRGDQVFYAPGWFGLHSKLSGNCVLRFPEEFDFENAISGERHPRGRELRLNMKRGESVLFRLIRPGREPESRTETPGPETKQNRA